MSEIRALLLTDVVDSTKLSEKLGDAAMAEVWAAHDRVARDLLPGFNGLEIDKTDGMLLMFKAATDAMSYATAYHRAMTTLPVPIKARAGLHVGPVILRENAPEDVARGAKPIEVDGLAKPTAARVMSLARGGQTLLTSDACAALGADLKVQSHGHWAIKGLAEPMELFEAEAPDAPMLAPPDGEKVYRVVKMGERWLPVKQVPNNLPQQASSFLGRERELGEVKALLGGVRLLTLLGMGGLGKTRLSLQVAAEVMHDYSDGVWFLDLAPIRDAGLVASEAAHVLEVQEEPGRPLLQTLCAFLKTRRVLIVMDNCEHLIAAAAEMANAMLRAAPGVRIIASSREMLRIPGEQSYPILPLPVPKRGDNLETLARSTAVRLFVERAQQHKPSFELNEREAPAVAELVARLEGIPLAIELAAARVRALSVADINTRLKDRYKILTGGGRVLQERQQTLRALVDWSYELLNPNEQAVLNRLGVFVGGFDLGAAEAVCAADPVEDFEVMDLLSSLVEKSLAMIEDVNDGTRYKMLETIREYAQEKLAQSGEQPTTAERHGKHYFALAKEANQGLKGAEHALWTERLETELDNVRSATTLALNGGIDPVISVKLAVAMQSFWMLRGYSTEGRNVVRAALALPEVQASNVALAHALYVGAALAWSQSDYAEARQMLETCLDLRRPLGNPTDIGATLSSLAMSCFPIGDVKRAREAVVEALEILRGIKYDYGECICQQHLGWINAYEGDMAQARTDVEASLKIAREISLQEVEGEDERMLGELDFAAGDLAKALERFTRSLTVCREAGDKRGQANAQRWLGKLELKEGQLESGRVRLGEALSAFREFEMRLELYDCLDDFANLARKVDKPDKAVSLSAVAAASRERLGLVRSPHIDQRSQGKVEVLRRLLGTPAFDAAWAEGSHWEIEEAIRQALALEVNASTAE